MPEPQPDWPRTLEEFRFWDERQPDVWEFIDGAPKLLAPGSKTHTILKSRVGRMLGNALDGTGCEAMIDGAVVEIEGSSLIPDVVLTCEPVDYPTPRVGEPIIIVEILSPSNERDDTGRKLALYLKIRSLHHYLVIHQDRRQIVHHERRDDLGGAFLTNIAPPDPLRLDLPGIDLPLAVVYDGVSFD